MVMSQKAHPWRALIQLVAVTVVGVVFGVGMLLTPLVTAHEIGDCCCEVVVEVAHCCEVPVPMEDGVAGTACCGCPVCPMQQSGKVISLLQMQAFSARLTPTMEASGWPKDHWGVVRSERPETPPPRIFS